VAKIPFRLVKF